MKPVLNALVVFLAASCCAVPVWATNAGATGALAPKELKNIDSVAGNGRPAMAGSTVTVNYTGWLYSPKAERQRGLEFDKSAAGAPFTFKLGTGKVIKGLEDGVRGMKVGGKRTLIIPAALGFADKGLGPVPPKANLIYDVELIDVKQD